MKMSHAQTRFFLGRFLLFWNKAKVAKLLGVAYPTLYSWIRGETLPSIEHLKNFESVLAFLVERIDEHAQGYGKWARDVADAVDQETPKWSNSAAPDQSHSHVVRLVREYLIDGPKPYKALEHDAAEKGFTRSQVQYAANTLGVIKQAHGQGRNSHSIWRLP